MSTCRIVRGCEYLRLLKERYVRRWRLPAATCLLPAGADPYYHTSWGTRAHSRRAEAAGRLGDGGGAACGGAGGGVLRRVRPDVQDTVRIFHCNTVVAAREVRRA